MNKRKLQNGERRRSGFVNAVFELCSAQQFMSDNGSAEIAQGENGNGQGKKKRHNTHDKEEAEGDDDLALSDDDENDAPPKKGGNKASLTQNQVLEMVGLDV